MSRYMYEMKACKPNNMETHKNVMSLPGLSGNHLLQWMTWHYNQRCIFQLFHQFFIMLYYDSMQSFSKRDNLNVQFFLFLNESYEIHFQYSFNYLSCKPLLNITSIRSSIFIHNFFNIYIFFNFLIPNSNVQYFSFILNYLNENICN